MARKDYQSLVTLKPIYINHDSDEVYTKPNEGKFIKNYRVNLNKNTDGVDSTQGQNAGVGTPLQSNRLVCEISLPQGKNMCIGSEEFEETGEVYFCVWNENGNHSLGIISADHSCKIVGQGSCFNFQLDPKYRLDNRMELIVVYNDDRTIREKYWTGTDGFNEVFWIPVLACMNTNTLTSGIFAGWQDDCCNMFTLNPTPPTCCPSVTPIAPKEDSNCQVNLLKDKSLQFAYRYIYNDGRASVLSSYSNVVLADTDCGGAITSAVCYEIEICLGNPLVDKVEIYQRGCEKTDWYLYDTIHKYEASNVEYWNRSVNSELTITDNKIKYEYCGDKECSIADQATLNMVQNDIPIKSYGLDRAGDVLLLANNLRGRDNFIADVKDNIEISASVVEDTDTCPPKPRRKIKIGLVVHNMQDKVNCRNQPVYNIDLRGAEPYNSKGKVHFGGMDRNKVIVLYPPTNPQVWTLGTMFEEQTNEYQQFMSGDDTNFRGFLRGTGVSAVAKQYKYSYNGGYSLFGMYGADGILHDKKKKRRWIRNNILDFIYKEDGFFIQIFEFEVDAGKYVFQVGGTGVEIVKDNTNLETSSTYTLGTTPFKTYDPKDDVAINHEKELLIDVCDGDYDFEKDGANGKILVVADNTTPRNVTTPDREKPVLVSGYVTGTKDGKKYPIELAEVTGGNYTNYTDHNGFYWAIDQNDGGLKNPDVQATIRYKKSDCTDGTESTETYKRVGDNAQFYEDAQIEDNHFSEIEGTITDCDGIPLSGIPLVSTRSGEAIRTTITGQYKFYVSHPYYGGANDTVILPQSNNGECVFNGCNCECYSVGTYTRPVCPDAYFKLPAFEIGIVRNSNRRLKSCGRYRLGVAGSDCEGRKTFVQPLGLLEIPDLNTIDFAGDLEVKVSIDPNTTFPDYVKCLHWYITKNINQSRYLQWSVDGIYYVSPDDNLVTKGSGSTNMAINIQSLLDYNENNNLSTNTTYQFVEGDFVRVLTDCNGDFLETPIQVRITGIRNGNFLLTEMNGELAKLVGCCDILVELVTPNTCETSSIYYEVCGCQEVVDGKVGGDYVLNVWDTYVRDRQVPNYTPPTEDEESDDDLYKCIKQGKFTYENNAPSDFWGEGCGSFGSVNIVDERAEQKWYPDEIQKSDDFVNEGRVNGLGTFRDNNRKSFKGQDSGGIIAIHAERNIIFCVAENNWYTLDFQMNYARMTEGGLIVANFEDSLSDPKQKVGSNFGCSYEDISSLVFDGGMVSWVDRIRGHIILSDYRSAIDILKTGLSGYLGAKIKHISEYDKYVNRNLLEIWDIVSTKDPMYNEIIFTFRKRNGLAGSNLDFINAERNEVEEISETWTYNIDYKKWVRSSAYTPENYGVFKTSNKGKNVIAFANGLPYTQNDNDVTTYNTFFGVKTEQVLDLVAFIPKREGEVNIYQSIAIDSDKFKYFIDRIFTDEANSNSYIPPVYFKRKENVYYAEILRDASSYVDEMYKHIWVSTLLDGKRIFGKFMRFRIVSTADGLGEYDEIDTIDVQIINSELTKH